MKNKGYIVVAVILACVSLALILYPTASQMINKMFDNNSIIQYNNQVSALSTTDKENMLSQAQEYNTNLYNVVSVSDSFTPNAFNIDDEYKKILSVTADGQIGSVSIPKINCNLPIYHGISEEVLDKGAVHMANTSFPIGGENTHAVVSAHTAYPGKEFFNKLTELEVGDYFYLQVLGDTLAYKVCRIDVVVPSDSRLLRVENGQDLVTLVTCTPYSVNTHRLLVRGQRDLTQEQKLQASGEEIKTSSSLMSDEGVLILVAVVAVTIMFIIIILILRRKRKENTNGKKD
ncbi:MAG: class C sortase [Ruminococcus sp.]|nr:class C sortase [Ruminococcus sp.]